MKAYRLGDVAWGKICGLKFANPHPDMNCLLPWFTCTCAPGHAGPHVAHMGDTPVAVAVEDA